MELLLSPKDNLNKVVLSDVKTYALEGETLLVVFEDGTTRNYPLIHLWYYGSHVDNHHVRLTGNCKKEPRKYTPGDVRACCGGNCEECEKTP